MKIAFLVGTLGQGGAEKQLFLLATELKKKGAHVKVYSLTKDEYWEIQLRNADLEVIHVGAFKSRLKRMIKIYEEVKAFQPELFYSYHFFTSMYVAIVGRLLGVFSIGSIRSDGYSEKKSNGLFSYLHFHLPHGVIANSKHGLLNAQKIFLWKRKNVAVLTNGIAVEKLGNERTNSSGSHCTILFVGRLEPIKRPLIFLEILSLLRAKVSYNIQAVVLGDGSMKKEMVQFCQKRNIQKEVIFKGVVPNVSEYMRKSDILLCTSALEGTANVVLEAMSIGLPVVSSKFEGIEELLGSNGERGLLFDEVDQALANICKIINDEGARATLRNNAYKHVAEEFSLVHLANRFENVLRKIGFMYNRD